MELKRHKFWVAKDGIAVSIIPKNASTSIRQVIGVSGVYDNEEVKQFKTRVAFIRDPFERLASAYSFFYYLRKEGHLGERKIPLDTYEDFIDFTLVSTDAHWEPQLSLIGDAATVYEKVDNILDVWGKYFEGFYPSVMNKVTRRDVDQSYRRSELEMKYREDIELCRSL